MIAITVVQALIALVTLGPAAWIVWDLYQRRHEIIARWGEGSAPRPEEPVQVIVVNMPQLCPACLPREPLAASQPTTASSASEVIAARATESEAAPRSSQRPTALAKPSNDVRQGGEP